MLKSSKWILEQCREHRLLDPFIEHSERRGVISYGLSPFGYDIRLDSNYKAPRPGQKPLDPHNCSAVDYLDRMEERIVLPAGSFILGKSLEYFRMPPRVLGIVFGKSTYARIGVIVNVTPLEPGWEGFLTISIANTGPGDVMLYPLEGIAQVLFFESDEPPVFSYGDLKGKYQNQKDITIARIQED
jgi:dCTP deaminase